MTAYLEKLNEQQRQAVINGVGAADRAPGGPLLISADAGSGKINRLAHCVAHLIVNGVGPCCILLMTFSRPAGSELGRRVDRICRQVLRDKAMDEALTW